MINTESALSISYFSLLYLFHIVFFSQSRHNSLQIQNTALKIETKYSRSDCQLFTLKLATNAPILTLPL